MEEERRGGVDNSVAAGGPRLRVSLQNSAVVVVEVDCSCLNPMSLSSSSVQWLLCVLPSVLFVAGLVRAVVPAVHADAWLSLLMFGVFLSLGVGLLPRVG